ncbi:MAG: flagellar motor protein MotB [Rhodospirillales bacterium]
MRLPVSGFAERSREIAKGPVLEDVQAHSDSVSKAWMITFSDLISLMLTFFVMLFAMSNVKIDAWKDVTDTLSRTLDPKPIEEPEPVTGPYNIASIVFEAGTSLEYLAGVLEEVLSGDELLSRSLMFEYNDRLIISIPAERFFEPGRTAMTDAAQLAVFQISGVVRNIENKLVVEVHTDSTRPADGGMMSNWELSIARASAVGALLRKSGVLQEIDAVGYADSRYNTLQNLDSAERERLANRIDLIIHPNIGRRSP